MNRKWIMEKSKNQAQKYQEIKSDTYQKIKNSIYLDDVNKEKALSHLENEEYNRLDLLVGVLGLGTDDKALGCRKLYEQLKLDFLRNYEEGMYDRYMDSEPMEFDGDIIITDPCYIVKEKESVGTYPKRSDYITHEKAEDYPDCREYTPSEINQLDPLSKILIELGLEKMYVSKQHQDEEDNYHKALEKYNHDNISDWELCNYGDEMDKLGITHYMTRDTLYGDWSCTTYDLNTEAVIGEFCADAGLVSVIALDEVLKYNPEFDYHKERPWTTTWIKDFKGTVQFVVTSDSEIINENELWAECSVEVVGHGINKITGEPINFVGRQTGL